MIELHLKIFGVMLDLTLHLPTRKKPINVIETPIDENIPQKEYNSFDEKEHENDVENADNVEIKISEIQSQALRFEEELKTLGIYDIPDTSDIAPTFEIQDDVEIITNDFEKEQEDMIKDRRR